MPWTVTVAIDPDKTNVGSASAVFTDTDGTTFAYSQRNIMTAVNANAFVAAAIAARNSWQTRKATEVSAQTTLVNDFTASGETATAGTAA